MRLIDTTRRRLAVLGRPYTTGADGAPVERPAWAAQYLTRVTLPTPLRIGGMSQKRATVRVHRLLAAQLRAVFADLVRLELWKHFATFDGDFVVRAQRGSRSVSAHAFGIALDFNASALPQGSRKTWPAEVITVFNAHGFVNGAGFRNPDPMHFEARRVA
jgi:hypothetical protein